MRAHTHTLHILTCTYTDTHTQTHTHRHTHRQTHTQTQTHTHRQTVIYIYLHLFTPAETYCEMYTDAYMCILHNDVDFAHAHINTIKHTHTFCMRVQFTSCQYMGCVHEPEPWACRIHMVGLRRGWIEEQHHRSLWDLLSRGRAGPHAGDSEFEDHRALQGEIRLAANTTFLSLKMFEVFVLKLSSWDGLILIIFEGFSGELQDPSDEARSVTKIGWHPEGPTKLVGSYSNLRFQRILAAASFVFTCVKMGIYKYIIYTHIYIYIIIHLFIRGCNLYIGLIVKGV